MEEMDDTKLIGTWPRSVCQIENRHCNGGISVCKSSRTNASIGCDIWRTYSLPYGRSHVTLSCQWLPRLSWYSRCIDTFPSETLKDCVSLSVIPKDGWCYGSEFLSLGLLVELYSSRAKSKKHGNASCCNSIRWITKSFLTREKLFKNHRLMENCRVMSRTT